MEDKELYNPQSGEKIAPKKPKKFWKDWKFYIYTIIALMLSIVSISSCVTACAAINAGVGSQEAESVSSSYGSPEVRSLRFDISDFSSYGHDANSIYNYSGVRFDMRVYYSDVMDMNSLSSLPGSVYSVRSPIASIEITCLDAICEGYYDLWCDGNFYNTVKVRVGTYSTLNLYVDHVIQNFSYSFFWLFEHDAAAVNDWNGVYDTRVVSFGFPGTESGYIYNYSTLTFNLASSSSSSSGVAVNKDLYRGNPMKAAPVPNSSVYGYSNDVWKFRSLVDVGSSYKDRLYLDVYLDGVYFGMAPVWYNPNSSVPTNYYFDLDTSGHYVWLFDHSAYDLGYSAGYAAGVSVSKGFNSVTCVEAGETVANFESYSDTLTYVYKFFEFVDGAGTKYSVYAVPFNLDTLSLDYLRVIVWSGYDFDMDDYYTDVQSTIGYLSLLSGMYYVTSNSTFAVTDGVVGNVFNDAFSRQLFHFVSSDVNPYSVGYENGRSDGYTSGFAAGRQAGLAEADPEALTTTLVTVFQQPFNQIYRFFNFNVLGLNVLALVTGLLSVAIVIKVLKKVRK